MIRGGGGGGLESIVFLGVSFLVLVKKNKVVKLFTKSFIFIGF